MEHNKVQPKRQDHNPIRKLELLLSTAVQTGDKTGEGRAYSNLGNCYLSLGQHEKAKEQHALHLNIAKQIGDKAGEGLAYGNLGVCYGSLGQYDKAKKQHELSLNIAKRIGYKACEGRAYSNLGICYHSLEQYDKAREQHELRLNIAKQIGDKAAEGNAHGNLGNCYHSLGQYNKAIEQHQLNLNIAKQIGNKAGEGKAYGNLGNCYYSQGQYNKAKEQHKLALEISKQLGDKHGEGTAYGNLGVCYHSLGQYDDARWQHELRLNIAKQLGDKAGEGIAYGNLGNCYLSLGQYNKAKEQHNLQLNIAKQIGDKAGEGIAYGNLGNCYYYLGQYDKAREQHELDLNIAKQIGNTAGERQGYGNLANCYYSLGQYERAKEQYESIVDIAKRTGDKPCEAGSYGNLGNCYFALGQYDKAEEMYELHLNIAMQIGDQAGTGIAYFNLGCCNINVGQLDKAEDKLRNSVGCYQELFKNTPKEDNLRVSFIETFSDVASFLLKILVVRSKTDEGLVFSEEVRSRALTELMLKSYHLHSAEHKVLDLPETLKVVKDIDSTVLFLSLRTSEICVWVITPNGDVTFKRDCSDVSPGLMESYLTNSFCSSAARGLNSLIDSAKGVLRPRCAVKCEDRSLSFLCQKEATEQIKIQASPALPLSTKKDKTALEPEVPRDKPPSLRMQGMSTTTPPKPRAGPEDQNEGKDADSGSGSDSDSDSASYDPLNVLYNILLAPVRQLIEGPQVVIVADGPLPLVPFPALIDENGRYVADSLQVRLVPSLATAKMIREHPQEPEGKASPLIVGDPDVTYFEDDFIRLPNAQKEALMIGQLLNVQPLTGEKATRQAVLDKLESANLIHIAAHGDAERGEILLAPSPGVDKKDTKIEDVMLTISHLEQKRLKAKLVVLSCCHSGHGEVKSEGVIGIARAFLGAGARAVLVTLWGVDDKATLYFMREFCSHLSEGKKASEALSRTMKAMRDDDDYCLPYYWAPFVLIGDDVTPLGVS